MCEKLLLAIGLTLALHLCTLTGLFSLSHTTQEGIQNETFWFVAHKHDNWISQERDCLISGILKI